MLFFFDHSITLLDMLAVKKNKATPMLRSSASCEKRRGSAGSLMKRGGEGERSSSSSHRYIGINILILRCSYRTFLRWESFSTARSRSSRGHPIILPTIPSICASPRYLPMTSIRSRIKKEAGLVRVHYSSRRLLLETHMPRTNPS